MKEECYNKFMASAFGDLLRILRIFEKNLDNEDFNSELFKELKITKVRFKSYIEMLQEAEYITGLKIDEYIDGSEVIDFSEARITIYGLKFLAENTMLSKTYKVIKDVSLIVKP